MYLRFWEKSVEDINQVKRMKVHKAIHEIISVSAFQKKNTLVVYEDGTAESLDSAMGSRVEKKSKRESAKPPLTIEMAQLTSGIFSYVKTVGKEKHFCFTTVDEMTLQTHENVISFKLERSGQNVRLMGQTVLPGKTPNADPSLITIWSDNRIFKQVLNRNNGFHTVGIFYSIVDQIDANNKLSIVSISPDCVAIYASKQGDDGSFVCIYNIRYKIIQSKVPFKVYLANFMLWSVHRNIFLAMGDQLSVIPYRITTDHLSVMVGSQCDTEMHTAVEKEMINEDLHYEEGLEFDDDQELVENMEFRVQSEDFFNRYRAPLSKAKPIVGADEVIEQLNELYREELLVNIIRSDSQVPGTVQLKLLSNIDETFPLFSENFELMCVDLERIGSSEIEITNKIIPILIKTNRTEDIGLLLKRYNHFSEEMLVNIIKYLLSCPADDIKAIKQEATEASSNEIVLDKSQICKEKKLNNVNVFLSTLQSEHRDVLSIVLCSSFDTQTIMKYLRRLTLGEMTQLMDHIYSILTVSSLDSTYDLRGNLVEGNDFDLDTKLFEWFKILLDSHYQQILLSHDDDLHKKLDLWLMLVDDHMRILNEMIEMRQILSKLSNNKSILLSKSCNQWYSIEKLEI